MRLAFWRFRRMTKSTSIFRYPGAKSSNRAREAIASALPSHFGEYRECFVGGGSIFFSMPTSKRRWINDANRPLVAVYEALQKRTQPFIEQLVALTAGADEENLRQTFTRLLYDDDSDDAIRYFLLNRCAFNGRVRLDDPWRHRTFFSNPAGMNIIRGDRLMNAARTLRDVRITCGDFAALFAEPGEDVLVFADPPYVRDTELSQSAKLYEMGFTLEDHHRLKQCIDRCQHNVLLTYDDHPLVRDLYREYVITPASWTYRGNDNRIVGRELVITNYDPRPQQSLATVRRAA